MMTGRFSIIFCMSWVMNVFISGRSVFMKPFSLSVLFVELLLELFLHAEAYM